MTLDTHAPATRRVPGDSETLPVHGPPAHGPPALGPLAVDLMVLGSRPRNLIDRIRDTGEAVVVLSRGRPVALISAYRAGETDAEEPGLWDVEAVAP